MDTTMTSEESISQIDRLFRLSGNRWIYWLCGSFAVPFILVFLLSVIGMYTILHGNVPPLVVIMTASMFYGLMAGVLGFVAVSVSLVAGRYWFLLASFTVPMLMIGGSWGSWGWVKHCDDIARDSVYQQAQNVSVWQQSLEWASYVADGCRELGLIAGFIVGAIACGAYWLSRKRHV